ncbi:CaiB/BaiF CoA transferase family protein [Flexibacterium corallicola]|uniref:CaiB/BaiF CoA transferase family protein n=1 Tax=Flexibacterium corallicola TaxID=3037259 RepID=UPI00286F8DA9|nr:CaiB/BaiF CoA-transferase family protein [Pseudovibrio sp. M1P-2-3]
MKTPLEGIRVVELARILAGPWIGQTLSDLGADVVKVESPDGDDTRTWGPPFIEEENGQTAAYFHACNRGKRSVTADFSNAEDLEFVKRLIAQSDVLIENFKVGGLKKYGLDYESLKKINPSLIYCSVTGFGQDGPYAHRAGYDFLIQGMGGIMDLTGEPDGEPQKIGVAFADIFTGLYGTIAVQAALHRRSQTGEGEWIDMALLDTQVGVLANQAMNYLSTGNTPKRLGNAHPNIVPYQVFAVKDGHIILAVGNDRQFQKFCLATGQKDLASDERFVRNSDRVANREALTSLLEVVLSKWERDTLLVELEKAGVPAGPINSVEQAMNDPQILHRELLVSPLDNEGDRKYLRTPIKYTNAELSLNKGVPQLGEHQEEIRQELERCVKPVV